MARGQNEFGSLRFSRRERELVLAALAISLALHLVVWRGYLMGNQHGWWKSMHLPAWMHLGAKTYPLQAQLGHLNQPQMFVDVSAADLDAPTRTRYYSNKNSRAANPETGNQDAPKITGHQADVPKTEDAPRPVKAAAEMPKADTAKTETPKEPPPPQVTKLQPTMPPPQLAPMENETPQTPGETDLPRPRPEGLKTSPAQTSQPAQPERPRTLKQALAQRDQLPGQKMRQDGGVSRQSFSSSLDVKATAFGDYDRGIIEAVSQRWYDLLDSRRFAQDRTGKVTLRFKLKSDGTIIEMKTVENNVGELLGYLCQEAIEEAAPFAKWPPDMVAMIGSNYRDITFTFYYY
jgi:hypothetical protein